MKCLISSRFLMHRDGISIRMQSLQRSHPSLLDIPIPEFFGEDSHEAMPRRCRCPLRHPLYPSQDILPPRRFVDVYLALIDGIPVVGRVARIGTQDEPDFLLLLRGCVRQGFVKPQPRLLVRGFRLTEVPLQLLQGVRVQFDIPVPFQ